MVVLQRALKVTADGDFEPRTRAALVGFAKLQKIPANGIANRLVWNRLETRNDPLIAYRGPTLKLGSSGAVVKVLQRALQMSPTGVLGLTKRGRRQGCSAKRQVGADRCSQRLDLGRDREQDAPIISARIRIDLRLHPSACIRLDQSALYIGSPGADFLRSGTDVRSWRYPQDPSTVYGRVICPATRPLWPLR